MNEEIKKQVPLLDVFTEMQKLEAIAVLSDSVRASLVDALSPVIREDWNSHTGITDAVSAEDSLNIAPLASQLSEVNDRLESNMNILIQLKDSVQL